MLPRLVMTACVALMCACTQRIVLEEPDAAPARDAGADGGGSCGASASVDLLMVIDNSNSMLEEQASLAAQLPVLVRDLVSPPDRDRDGVPDWDAVRDLHLGVVTTNMGAGGYDVPTCLEPVLGDDGRLRTEGNTSISGCATTYPAFLTARPGITDPDAIAADFACVAQAGTAGCGLEQTLEAGLKALTPSTSPVRFFMDTVGHADGANAGFVRDDSLLVLLVMTDEDDCSAADPTLYDPASPRYPEDFESRCAAHPAALQPLGRYVDGVSALRASQPDLLLFAAIAGVPVDLLEGPDSASFDEILADPRMAQRVDVGTGRLVPSCTVAGRGEAYPPRRIVEMARELPGRSVVQSICQLDFGAAMARIVAQVGRRACLRPGV